MVARARAKRWAHWSGALLCAAAHLGGCVDALPRYSNVEDLRVLGVRAEPPEMLDDPLPTEIRFDALVVDPRPEREVELYWQFCPVQTGNACRGFEAELARALDTIDQISAGFGAGGSGGAGAGVDCAPSAETTAALVELAGVLEELADPDTLRSNYRDVTTGEQLVLGTGEDATARYTPIDVGFVPSFAADLEACGALPETIDPARLPRQTSDLHLFHLFSNPINLLLGAWPSVVLTARSGTSREDVLLAQKRINLTVRDPTATLDTLRLLSPDLELGLDLCPTGGGEVDCVDLRPRTPNQNPRFADVRVARGERARDPADADFVSIVAGPDCPGPDVERPPDLDPAGELQLTPVELAPGEAIRILPVFGDDATEPYQSLSVDLETSAVVIRELREELSITWFATAGNLQDVRTWVKLTKSLDTAYHAPPATVAQDLDVPWLRLWMVARDQRGGMAWQEIDVHLAPAGARTVVCE